MRFVSRGWVEILPEQSAAAARHRELAEEIFGHFRYYFVLCLATGRAHIIARKNTLLAPFERVTWDQWQYFKLDPHPDDEPWRERTETDFCHTPYDDLPSTATGSSGEKLYSIHVVPGSASSAESDDGVESEHKLLQWLLGLMQQFPDRPPMPLRDLVGQAISESPGLTERGFRRALSFAQQQSGNRNWSKAGRRPKLSQKSPHQN
jgi:hypothetical protein